MKGLNSLQRRIYAAQKKTQSVKNRLTKAEQKVSSLKTELINAKKNETFLKTIDLDLELDKLTTLSETCKYLELPFGKNSLLKHMRVFKVVQKFENLPFQRHVDLELFVSDGGRFLITPKGLIFLEKKFKKMNLDELLKFRGTNEDSDDDGRKLDAESQKMEDLKEIKRLKTEETKRRLREFKPPHEQD